MSNCFTADEKAVFLAQTLKMLYCMR